MEDLLIAILQGIFEFLLEVFSYTPFDWPFTGRKSPEPETITSRCVTWFVVGCGLAWVSMFVFRHTWISHPALRIVNLIVAPVTSAFISQAIARRRACGNPFIIPRNHFWQSFWFTLGIVTVRFAYAIRH
jgi:hypothetical protein